MKCEECGSETVDRYYIYGVYVPYCTRCESYKPTRNTEAVLLESELKHTFTENIIYASGYKHQLKESFSIQTALRPQQAVIHEFFFLSTSGIMHIFSGYAWDGASGPAFDTLTILKGSLVHDVLYQAIELGLLPKVYNIENGNITTLVSNKDLSDSELFIISRVDGMVAYRASWVFLAVQKFGARWQIFKKHRLRSAPNRDWIDIKDTYV